MAAPGTPFESPRACPFVALEMDRDKRSDRPDYRHRCFAEPTPAPRSIAHQEAYCLSPNFPACPVFQDWAVRAAARPAAGSGATVASGPAVVGGAVVGAAAVGMAADDGGGAADDTGGAPHEAAAEGEHADHDAQPYAAPVDEPPSAAPADDAPAYEPPSEPESAVSELPEDASVTVAGAEIAAAAAAATGMGPALASPPTFATTDWQSAADESQQLAAFDSPQSSYEPNPDKEAYSSYGAPDAGYQEPPETPVSAPFVPPPTPPGQPETQHDEAGAAAAAAVPAFLAGRSSRPPAQTTTAAGGTPPPRPPTREEIVPSWEIDGRYGAEGPPLDQGGGGSRIDGILTAIAVVAILALGVAAVVFLPGLLNRGPAATPRPSVVLPSSLPTAVPSGVSSAAPSLAPSAGATAAPTTPASVGPESSPRLYKIKAGDSLAKIANRFDVLVQAILDANPEITNPNNIFVGQIIVIPPSATSSPSP